MGTDNVQDRISELIAELSDCREDERNTQNQILQVISVAGAVLGILFSASYLNDETGKAFIVFQNVKADTGYVFKFCNMVNRIVTYNRVMFWLSLLIFFTAFAYIVVLGINNILRYYYIQNLEDRLHELIPIAKDDIGRGFFLHWNAYIAPIITQKPKHIASTHTLLNFICYSLATCFAILFSMGMVISLFFKINPRERFDYIVIIIVVCVMVLTFVLFLRTSSKANEVAQFAWDMAHENQKNRLLDHSKQSYKKSKSFRHILLYLIYPKKKDWYKSLLIVLGFIYGIILTKEINNIMLYVGRLIFVLFIFDFLAYQARYQINDIRGLKEDKEVGHMDRLLPNEIDNPGHVIKVSFIVAFFRIIMSLIMVTICGGEIRGFLLICLVILFGSTILYETARSNKNIWLIFILVGTGYPLRFFVGFCLMIPMNRIIVNIQIVCFILALWAYGSSSSILAWTDEVIKRMQEAKKNYNSFPISYEKKHFAYIQSLIRGRYILGESHPVNGRIMPLREKGRLRDPWNLTMMLCTACLFFLTCFGIVSSSLLIIEFVIFVTSFISIYLRYKRKVILMCVGWVCIIGKVIIGIIFLEIPIWYLLFSIVQFIIAITYFVLLYQPQIKKIDYKKLFLKLKRGILIKVLGEYAFNVMDNERNGRK